MAEIDLGRVVGPQGIPGENGRDGQDGLSPHIDAAGNWFIGSVDTGVKAAGRDGVSVRSIIQTTVSDEDGGVNVITVTLSDDTTTTFRVRNGTGGASSSGSNGRDGISVDSVVQTTTSNEDGGTNIITVTLSDGAQSTFKVKNGEKGSPGAKGADGVSIASIRQTAESTTDGGTNTFTVIMSDGSSEEFHVRNGTRGAAGAGGTDGAEGFSPVIVENSGNNADTFRLDITTKDGAFTTPNLKGADGKDSTRTEEILQMLGGLKFAQNEEGAWGYIVPGTTEITAFGGGSGGGFEACRWYVTDECEAFAQNGASWSISMPSKDTNEYSISLGIVVPKQCTVNFHLNLNSFAVAMLQLNGAALYNRGIVNSSSPAVNQDIAGTLVEGINTLTFICRNGFSTSYTATAAITAPAVLI